MTTNFRLTSPNQPAPPSAYRIASLYLTRLVGRTEVKFDVRKFDWIGSQEK